MQGSPLSEMDLVMLQIQSLHCPESWLPLVHAPGTPQSTLVLAFEPVLKCEGSEAEE